MLTPDTFDSYRPLPDRFDTGEALRLDDIPKWYEPKSRPLAILISTWNRRAQLARCLECLARQSFADFTVYLNDDGSEQDIASLVRLFDPYLDICFRRAPRSAWRSCPSSAYRAFLDEDWLDPEHETIAIMHPEMMLPPDGTKALHFLHQDPTLFDTWQENPGPGVAGRPVTLADNTGLWVTLQALFVDENIQGRIDAVDWHVSLDNLQQLPQFWSRTGLSHQSNRYWLDWATTKRGCPWWYVASAKANDPLWQDLPVSRGHATIDMFLITYRAYGRMLDLTPKSIYAYHQAHATVAVAPQGENDQSTEVAKERARNRLENHLEVEN